MKLLLALFFGLITNNFQLIYCNDFVSIIIPKFWYNNDAKCAKAFVKVNGNVKKFNISEFAINMEIFRKIITADLTDNNSLIFAFLNHRNLVRNYTNVTMILYRKKNEREKVIHQCITKINQINNVKSYFHIFIQLDKPIYKPGDDVRYQVIVVDKNLAPYYMNNIKVEISNPSNRTMQIFDDPEDVAIGLFENKYSLDLNALLGDWIVSVEVDRMSFSKTSKIFHVQNFPLPLFEVNIQTSLKYYLPYSKLRLSFNAKYYDGNYVLGNAELTIQDISNSRTYFTRSFNSSSGVERIMLDIGKDLKLADIIFMNLKATVTFTELQTNNKITKSTYFNIQNSLIEEVNGTSDENDQEVAVPNKIVDINQECGSHKQLISKIDNINHHMKKIEIQKNPLTLNYNIKRDIATIYVNSAFKMTEILVAVISKREINKFFTKSCGHQTFCNFSIETDNQIMPIFTVEVHHVRNIDDVEFGSIDIKTTEKAANYLKMKLSSKKVNVGSNVQMHFDTNEKSTVYILAVDKRLKFWNNKNYVTKNDTEKEIYTNNRQTQVVFDDLTNWHICTAEELKRVEVGRVSKPLHRRSIWNTYSDDDSEIDLDEDLYDVESIHESEEKDDRYTEREYYPEVWIFDNFKVEDSSITKTYKVPDLVTTWYISAFSIHPTYGLTLMEPQELIVQKDFFIDFDLPSSIKYTDILRIDVLIFNNIKTNEQLNVRVLLKNKNPRTISFVEFTKQGKTCKPTYNNDDSTMQGINILETGMRKVSFFIRPDFNSVGKIIELIIAAKAVDNHGMNYFDIVKKKLKIIS